jgi:hypothetical protein
MVAVGTRISLHPPGRRRRSPAPGSHRTWRADFPHHALRQLVHSFHCYLFKFRFHGPRSTISQYGFHPVIRPFSPLRLGRSYKLVPERDGSPLFTLLPLVACWRYEPREHLRPLAIARAAIPPSPLRDRVGYSDHDRFQPPCLRFADSEADRSTLFASFAGTIDESDFFAPFIIGYGLRPSRCGPGNGFPRAERRSPGSRTRDVRTCSGSNDDAGRPRSSR